MTFTYYISYFFRVEKNVLEVLLCGALFFIGHKRNKRFALRYILGVLVCLLYCAGVSAVYCLAEDTLFYIPVKLFVYISAYILAIAVGMSCWKDCFSELLLCGLSGVAAQCITSNITSLLYLDMYQWFLAIPYPWHLWIYQIVGYCFNSPWYLLIYLLFARGGERLTDNESSKVILALAGGILVVSTILSSLISFYMEESQPLFIIASLSVIACSVLVLLIRRYLVRADHMEAELAVVEGLYEQEQKQFERIKGSMDVINVKCHDLKHQIRLLGDKLDEEELASLRLAAESFDSIFHTNNETVDVILNEKNFYCLKNNIRFTVLGDAAALSFMKPSELYSLFGNALDNAIEGVGKVTESDKRAINLVLKQDEEQITIDLMNYFSGEIRLKDGLPVTDKEDKRYHGFGMKSMEITVKKYGGQFAVQPKGDIFRLLITLPLKK